MSLNRATTTIGFSAISTIRTTGLSHISATRACSRGLSSHIRPRPRQPLSRRHFAAAAQPQPQTFDPPAGPRNTGVPETSIAGGQPDADPINSGYEQRTDTIAPNTSHQAEQNQSIPESEAQTPRPTSNAGKAVGSVASPDPSPQDAQGKPKRKSKLRPRKAAMSLSPAAVKALRELLDQDQKMIRVGVKNRGCSGLAYHLEYVDKPGSFDEAVDQDGVKVLIDSKALFSIIGSEMDWVEDKLSRRFVFKNPNITEQCGCGESFSIS